jgi:hypothetical protein
MKPPACALCGQSIFLEPPNLEHAAALADRIVAAIAAELPRFLETPRPYLEDRDGRRFARAAIARALLEGYVLEAVERAAEGLMHGERLEELAAAGDSERYAELAAELDREAARLEGEGATCWEPLELFDDPGEKPGEPPSHRGRT